MMRPAAMVTGARRGIGRATCIALAEKGFDIVGVDIAEEGAEETARHVAAAGGRFVWLCADIAETAAHPQLVDQGWEAFGGLECLANVAGVQVTKRGDMLETTPQSWDHVLGVNAGVPFSSLKRWHDAC